MVKILSLKSKILLTKSKTRLESANLRLKRLRKEKLDTEGVSILYNKEGYEPAIFTKRFSKTIDNKLVIQTNFYKKVHNKLKTVKPQRII